RLPDALELLTCATVDELCDAMPTMAIRGAPALGEAGAMGVALAHVRGEDVAAAADRLIGTRPTAVNLAWGVRRAVVAADPVAEATAIAAEDVARNRALGAAGAHLIADGARVLTHCNAGALACVGYGTAIGVIRAAHDLGRKPFVWVDETRPVLQGARLTAWELGRLGIGHAGGAGDGLRQRGGVDTRSCRTSSVSWSGCCSPPPARYAVRAGRRLAGHVRRRCRPRRRCRDRSGSTAARPSSPTRAPDASS